MLPRMIGEFIQALGGATQVARELELKRGRVAMWSTNNRVPIEHRAALIHLAVAKQVRIPAPVSDGVVVVLYPKDAKLLEAIDGKGS